MVTLEVLDNNKTKTKTVLFHLTKTINLLVSAEAIQLAVDLASKIIKIKTQEVLFLVKILNNKIRTKLEVITKINSG